MVTPLGVGVEESWKGLVAGKNAVNWITVFDASSFPTKIAAEVRNFDFEKLLEGENIYEKCGRNTKFAVIASQMAMKDAGLPNGNYDPERIGVYLGAGEGMMDFDSFFRVIFESSTDERVEMDKYFRGFAQTLDKMRELQQEPNIPGAHIAIKYDVRGINYNTLTACAASSQATGERLWRTSPWR